MNRDRKAQNREQSDQRRRVSLHTARELILSVSRYCGNGGLNRVHDRLANIPKDYIVGCGQSAIVHTVIHAIAASLHPIPIQFICDTLKPVLLAHADDSDDPMLKDALIATAFNGSVYLHPKLLVQFCTILKAAFKAGFPSMELLVANNLQTVREIWARQITFQADEQAKAESWAKGKNLKKKKGAVDFKASQYPDKSHRVAGILFAGHSLFTGLRADEKGEEMSNAALAENFANAEKRKQGAIEAVIELQNRFNQNVAVFRDGEGPVLIAPPLPVIDVPPLQIGEYPPQPTDRDLARDVFRHGLTGQPKASLQPRGQSADTIVSPPLSPTNASRPPLSPTSYGAKKRTTNAYPPSPQSPLSPSRRKIGGEQGIASPTAFVPGDSTAPLLDAAPGALPSSTPPPPVPSEPAEHVDPPGLSAEDKAAADGTARKKLEANARAVDRKRDKLSSKCFSSRKELLRINQRFSKETQREIQETIEEAVYYDSHNAVMTSWILLVMINGVIAGIFPEPSLSSIGKNSNLHDIVSQCARVKREGSNFNNKDGTSKLNPAVDMATKEIVKVCEDFKRLDRLKADSSRIYDSSTLMTSHIKLHLSAHKKFGIPHYVINFINLTLLRLLSARLYPFAEDLITKRAPNEETEAWGFLSTSDKLRQLGDAVFRAFSNKPVKKEKTSADMVDANVDAKEEDTAMQEEEEEEDEAKEKKKKLKAADSFCQKNAECQEILRTLTAAFWNHANDSTALAEFQRINLRQRGNVNYAELDGDDGNDGDAGGAGDADYDPNANEDAEAEADANAVVGGGIEFVAKPKTDLDFALGESECNQWASLRLLQYIISQQALYIADARSSGVFVPKDDAATADKASFAKEVDPTSEVASDDRGGDDFVDPRHSASQSAILSNSTSDSSESPSVSSSYLGEDSSEDSSEDSQQSAPKELSVEDSKRLLKVRAFLQDGQHACGRNTTLIPMSTTRMHSISLRLGFENMFSQEVQRAVGNEVFRMQTLQNDKNGSVKITFIDALFPLNGPRSGETRIPTTRTNGVDLIPFYKKNRPVQARRSLQSESMKLAIPSLSKPLIQAAATDQDKTNAALNALNAAKANIIKLGLDAHIAEAENAYNEKNAESIKANEAVAVLEGELAPCLTCKSSAQCRKCTCLVNRHWCIPGVCSCRTKTCTNFTQWLHNPTDLVYDSCEKLGCTISSGKLVQCKDSSSFNVTTGGGTTTCCGRFFHQQCMSTVKTYLCYSCGAVPERILSGKNLLRLRKTSVDVANDAKILLSKLAALKKNLKSAENDVAKAKATYDKAAKKAPATATANDTAQAARAYLGSFRTLGRDFHLYEGSVTENDNNRVSIVRTTNVNSTDTTISYHLATIRGARVGDLDAKTHCLLKKLVDKGCLFEVFLCERDPSDRIVAVDVHVKGPEAVRSDVADLLTSHWIASPRVYCSQPGIFVPPPDWIPMTLKPDEVPADYATNRETRAGGLRAGSDFYQNFHPCKDPRARHEQAESEKKKAERELSFAADHLLSLLAAKKKVNPDKLLSKADREALGRTRKAIRDICIRIAVFREAVKAEGYYLIWFMDPGRRNVFKATRKRFDGTIETVTLSRAEYRNACGTYERIAAANRDVEHLAEEYSLLSTVTAKTGIFEEILEFVKVSFSVHDAIMQEKKKRRWRDRDMNAWSKRQQAIDSVLSKMRDGDAGVGTGRRFNKQKQVNICMLGAGMFPSQGPGSPGGGVPTVTLRERLDHIFGSSCVIEVDEHRSTRCCAQCGFVMADVQCNRQSHFHARRDYARNIVKPPDKQVNPRTWFTVNGLKYCPNPLCAVTLVDRDFYPTLSIGDASFCLLRNEPPPAHMRRGKGVHPEDVEPPAVRFPSLHKSERFIKERFRAADLLKPAVRPPPIDYAALSALSPEEVSKLGRNSPGRRRRKQSRKIRWEAKLAAAASPLPPPTTTTTTTAAATEGTISTSSSVTASSTSSTTTTTAATEGAITTSSSVTASSSTTTFKNIGAGTAGLDASSSNSVRPETREDSTFVQHSQQGSASSALAAHVVHSTAVELHGTKDATATFITASSNGAPEVPLLQHDPHDVSGAREGLG